MKPVNVIALSDNGVHRSENGQFWKTTLWQSAIRVPLIIRTPQMLPKPSAPKSIQRQSNTPVSLLDIYPTLYDYCISDFEGEGLSIRMYY